jgi:hypothetical protein
VIEADEGFSTGVPQDTVTADSCGYYTFPFNTFARDPSTQVTIISYDFKYEILAFSKLL